MNIIIDDKIRHKWHSGNARYSAPNEIVLHGTGGGGTYNWVLGGGRASEYVQGIALFHYLIENDRTLEIIDPDRWVFHSSSGYHDRSTIGIELLNTSPQNKIPYSEDQYRMLFDLLILLTEKYPIDTITSHSYNAKKYSNRDKDCPGAFDWEKLEQWFTDAGFSWKKEDDEKYTIGREQNA